MTDDKSGCGEKRAAAEAGRDGSAQAAAFCDFFCIAAEILKNVVLLVFYLAVAPAAHLYIVEIYALLEQYDKAPLARGFCFYSHSATQYNCLTSNRNYVMPAIFWLASPPLIVRG